MQLQNRVKWGSDGNHRIMAPEQTVARVERVMGDIGVTRVADVSWLDSSGGVAIYSAIRPTDIGMAGVSVYNGKGLTPSQAKAGALMEAIERYCAESWTAPALLDTYEGLTRRLEATDASALDPNRMHLLRHDHARFDHSQKLEWGEGWALRSGRPIWIPLTFLLLGYDGPQCSSWYQTSNGLASGNCVEEAICHGLAELIERDAYTMAMVSMAVVPRVQTLVTALTEAESPAQTTGLSEAFAAGAAPFVELETLPPALSRIAHELEAAGVEVALRYLPSDTGVPAFAALVRTPFGLEQLDTGGFGCHLNAEIAASRAISEAIQSRATLIQGSREDIPSILAGGHGRTPLPRQHTGPPPAPLLWQGDRSAAISFAQIPSRSNSNLLDDIEQMLDGLALAGIEDAYVADLSRPEIPASVARVVVPELEVWFATGFDTNSCNLGTRARRLLTLAASDRSGAGGVKPA